MSSDCVANQYTAYFGVTHSYFGVNNEIVDLRW